MLLATRMNDQATRTPNGDGDDTARAVLVVTRTIRGWEAAEVMILGVSKIDSGADNRIGSDWHTVASTILESLF